MVRLGQEDRGAKWVRSGLLNPYLRPDDLDGTYQDVLSTNGKHWPPELK